MSLESFGALIPSMALEMAVKGAVICLAALGAAAALRRASASSRHLVLALSTAILVVLPVLALVLPSWEMAVLPAVEAQAPLLSPTLPTSAAAVMASDAGARLEPAREQERAGAAARLPISLALPVLALAVSTLLLLRLLVGVARLAGLAAEAVPAPRDWVQLLDEQRRKLGIASAVRLGVSEAIAVPVTFGWKSPVVLLPETARQWQERQLREALVHELAHVQRRDWPVQISARFACALHWFNPLVWRLARRLLLEAEHASDDQVLRAGVGAEEYAERLVALAREVRRAAPPAAAVAIARSSGLARRVTAILDAERRRSGPGRLAMAGAAGAALIFLLVVAPVRLVRAAEPPREKAPQVSSTAALPPLHRAAREGDVAEVRRLLAAGADPNADVPGVGTALRLAIDMDRAEVARVLLEAGADPLPEPMRRKAVEQGVKQGVEQGVKQGMEQGAKQGVEQGVKQGVEQGVEQGVKQGVEQGVKQGVEQGVEEGRQGALIEAAEKGDSAAVRFLLDKGAAPNHVVPGHGTPLIAAAREGHVEIVRLLLDAGADPNLRAVAGRIPPDRKGEAQTPLNMARRRGHRAVEQLLRERGATE
ncbi:MAG: bla regulator protein blaR1 [Acidobacteriota bacterium]|jgi:beta-lactamase regulating signal transducer with metallopeptidase domain|nr:bla regulator protein blaR1 [Acidobacteriota bacterium]